MARGQPIGQPVHVKKKTYIIQRQPSGSRDLLLPTPPTPSSTSLSRPLPLGRPPSIFGRYYTTPTPLPPRRVLLLTRK